VASTFTARLGLNKQIKGDNPGAWATDFATGQDNAEARFMLSGAGAPMDTGGVSLVEAHFVGQKYFDTTNEVWWTCRTLGAIGVSVWVTTEHNIGDIKMSAYDPGTPPKGWLETDQVVLRADYPLLFEVIGTDWDTGGELVTEFRLPTMGERVPVGETGAGDYTMANLAGEDEVTLLVANLAAHTHVCQDDTHDHPSRYISSLGPNSDRFVTSGAAGSPSADNTMINDDTHNHTIDSAGSDTPHENRQPFTVVGFLIFAAESP
jgi:microcystin-dependent protein